MIKSLIKNKKIFSTLLPAFGLTFVFVGGFFSSNTRLEKIAEYALETEAPYEFLAAEFDVPVIIVEDCIKRAIAKDRIKYEKLNKIYDKSNQIESSIEDIERTYKAYNLVLRGYEIDDIVKARIDYVYKYLVDNDLL